MPTPGTAPIPRTHLCSRYRARATSSSRCAPSASVLLVSRICRRVTLPSSPWRSWRRPHCTSMSSAADPYCQLPHPCRLTSAAAVGRFGVLVPLALWCLQPQLRCHGRRLYDFLSGHIVVRGRAVILMTLLARVVVAQPAASRPVRLVAMYVHAWDSLPIGRVCRASLLAVFDAYHLAHASRHTGSSAKRRRCRSPCSPAWRRREPRCGRAAHAIARRPRASRTLRRSSYATRGSASTSCRRGGRIGRRPWR